MSAEETNLGKNWSKMPCKWPGGYKVGYNDRKCHNTLFWYSRMQGNVTLLSRGELVPWRTLTYRSQVRLRICPLGQLSQFKSTVKHFLVFIVTVIKARGLRSPCLGLYFFKIFKVCSCIALLQKSRPGTSEQVDGRQHIL